MSTTFNEFPEILEIPVSTLTNDTKTKKVSLRDSPEMRKIFKSVKKQTKKYMKKQIKKHFQLEEERRVEERRKAEEEQRKAEAAKRASFVKKFENIFFNAIPKIVTSLASAVFYFIFRRKRAKRDSTQMHTHMVQDAMRMVA